MADMTNTPPDLMAALQESLRPLQKYRRVHCPHQGCDVSTLYEAEMDAHVLTCPPSQKPKAPFVPPADSAINVRDIPIEVYGVPAWGYYLDWVSIILVSPRGPDGSGPWFARWDDDEGDMEQAFGRRPWNALRDATADFPDDDVAGKAVTALLARKTEYTWRGAINDEAISAAWDEAHIEAAARRVLALTSAADLDAAR